MNQLLEWLSRLFGSWKFWVVVPPWDIAVRVRLGKKAKALTPGPHFRIPFLDDITLVNTRLRVTTAPSTTVGGLGGKSRVITAIIGYRVREPLTAILRFDDPHIAVQSYASAEVAACQDAIRCRNTLKHSFDEAGIEVEFVRFIEDIEAQTFRLLQNNVYGISSAACPPSASGGTEATRY